MAAGKGLLLASQQLKAENKVRQKLARLPIWEAELEYAAGRLNKRYSMSIVTQLAGHAPRHA